MLLKMYNVYMSINGNCCVMCKYTEQSVKVGSSNQPCVCLNHDLLYREYFDYSILYLAA